METKDYDLGTFVVPKNGYKVSETTAAVVDCIRMLDALYSKISDMLDMVYGDHTGEERMNETYYPHWSGLEDLLLGELKESVLDNLAELSNLNNENEILL